MLSSRFAGIPISSSTIDGPGLPQLLIRGERAPSAVPAQVAGFISEWWPASFRNGGRLQIGIGGRIASEFALDASNRLFNIVKAMSEIDLHPDSGIDNLMGYLFEHLIMRFNEQANEEAGDHFTPREVIRLMTHLVYTGEEDVYKRGVYREIYDPACGTGGMLSVSEETIRSGNASANLGLH